MSAKIDFDCTLPLDVDNLYNIAKETTSNVGKSQPMDLNDEDDNLLKDFVVIEPNSENQVKALDEDFVIIDIKPEQAQHEPVTNEFVMMDSKADEQSKAEADDIRDFIVIDINDDTSVIKQHSSNINIIEDYEASKTQKAIQLLKSLNGNKQRHMLKIAAPIIGGIALGLFFSPFLTSAALTIGTGLVSALKQKESKIEAGIGAGVITASLQLMANIIFSPLVALPVQIACSALGVYSLISAKDMLKSTASDNIHSTAINWLDSIANQRIFSKKPLYFLKGKFSEVIDNYFADINSNKIPELEQMMQDKFFSLIQNVGVRILKALSLKKEVQITSDRNYNQTEIIENYQDTIADPEMGLGGNEKAVSWKDFVQYQKQPIATVNR